MSPRPNISEIPELAAPSYEEILLANAAWLNAKTLPVFPGVPTVAVQLDADYVKYLAGLMIGAARLLEGNA